MLQLTFRKGLGTGKQRGLQQLVRMQGEGSRRWGAESGGVVDKGGKGRIGERYECKNQQGRIMISGEHRGWGARVYKKLGEHGSFGDEGTGIQHG